MKSFWSEQDVSLLRELYPHFSTAYVARRMGRTISSVYGGAFKYGLSKSEEYLASDEACRMRKGDDRGSLTRFTVGQVPHNKGIAPRKGWGPGRMKETQFKKGTRLGAAQHNWVPIGTVRKDKEGYLRIKVREHQPGENTGFGNTKVWPLVHRHVWEQSKGPIPRGHAICFIDENRDHCAIENLECVSRVDLMKRNTLHRFPKEIVEVIQLRGALNRRIRRKNEEQNLRSA